MIEALLIGGLAAIYAFYRLCRYDRQRLQEYARWAEEFHDAAKPLIDDDETPDKIIVILSVLNRKLSDPSSARGFLFFLGMRPQVSVAVGGPPDELRTFFRRRPELESKFVGAVGAALLAMSYRSRFWGYKLRLWLSTIETVAKTEQVAVSYSRYASPLQAA